MNALIRHSLLVCGVLLVTAAQADVYADYARVKSVVPEYERVNQPRQECYNEVVETRVPVQRQYSEGPEYGGTVLGGIVGGVIGNRFGKGHGREAATAAGAVAGALIGSQYDNRGRTEVIRDEGVQEREVRRCRDIDQWVNRITGYRVTYEYAGRRYSSFMPNDPGREVKVRVSVEPQS